MDLTNILVIKDRVESLEEYLKLFKITLSVMQTPESLERCSYELIEDVFRENVRYIEIRYSPILHIEKGMTMEESVEAVQRGLIRGQKEFGVRSGIIICGIRDISPEISLQLAEITVQYKDKGVIGFDLAGAEENFPAKKHREAFYLIQNNNINIRAIAQGASERNISIIIDEKDNIKALNSLHEAFFENNCKNVHLFITGVGNVGSNLIKQIFDQKKTLEENLRLKLKVMGLSNSKKMILSDTEIDLNDWKSKLDSSDLSSHNDQFLNFSINQNLRNSIFIDNTANGDVTINYNKYLKNGIGIVTCNKIACSDNLEKYLELKSLSRNHNSPFLYETNVGAALPIINTLNNLINSGDRITKIEAILSGTLNFIFNNFNKENSFYEVVKKAVDLGYTEPDPKIDLCGIDVSRKILILARESGKKMEFSDVQNKIFLPKESLESNSKEEFLKSLKDNNDHFNQILNKAIENRSRLKYVACLENDMASVGLKTVKEDHPFYNIEGRDNITVFHTDRYKDSPLVVKGPGAGGEFTASGVFADIIKASDK